jgi:hypothetical protein
VQGEPGNRDPCCFDFAFDFDLDFDFGWWSGVVVPDLDLLLSEGLRSGTFETERSHPPALVGAEFLVGGQRLLPNFRVRARPGFVCVPCGYCAVGVMNGGN